MSDFAISIPIFLCLSAAALVALFAHRRLPERHRDDETNVIVRLVAAIFVTLSALVVGLLLNSSKNAFDAIDRNFHAFSTQIILLDRTLRIYGPETAAARKGLEQYVVRALDGTWTRDGQEQLVEDPEAERLLEAVATSIRALKPVDDDHVDLKRQAQERLRKAIELRWDIIGHWDGNLPPPLVVVLVAWLSLVFAGFGYRAPPNGTIVASVLAAALLIAGAIHLILDMDAPFGGSIRISPAPLEKALEHIRR
ncbi:MAG: hypothetical protein DI565_06745 [Ancylobacter novellus]|uniref:DUF4239 domain-containing protein n=1 Tax=Ancylobacter novellus TaxID=921 RepID=A0A2W5KQE6_ANCNO|nr:MAG: hypothetical protein DI565_06745 [Ancylobacter novellus]